MSLNEAAASNRREHLPARVAAALAAAKISPSKLGPARRASLADSEQELYLWILRRFAMSGRPSSSEIQEAAAQLGAASEEALEVLAREDLVHRGRDGEITVAYPFSGSPTEHRVRFQSGNEAYSMCAIDALGVAPMFQEPIEIASRDPLTAEAIRAQVAPDGSAQWWPESAVVVAGVLDRPGESFRGCCPVLNFFASSGNAERWLAERPHVRGSVISMPDAIASGRAVFGDVLREE